MAGIRERLAAQVSGLATVYPGLRFGTPERQEAERAWAIPMRCECRGYAVLHVSEDEIESGRVLSCMQMATAADAMICEHYRHEAP
jgi:hypothetical protein